MDPLILLRGVAIGFAIAAPVGPVGVLVIRRTLARGALVGLVSGLGAATADAAYGAVAAFGLTLVSQLLLGPGAWIRLVGGLVLLYLGVTILLSRPATAAATGEARSLPLAYGTVALLTLTNPATIVSFAAVFASVGVGTHGRYAGAALLVLGVFLGSSLWWLVLSSAVNLVRARLRTRGLRWVNLLSGAVITLFGAGALLSVAASLRRSPHT